MTPEQPKDLDDVAAELDVDLAEIDAEVAAARAASPNKFASVLIHLDATGKLIINGFDDPGFQLFRSRDTAMMAPVTDEVRGVSWREVGGPTFLEARGLDGSRWILSEEAIEG